MELVISAIKRQIGLEEAKVHIHNTMMANKDAVIFEHSDLPGIRPDYLEQLKKALIVLEASSDQNNTVTLRGEFIIELESKEDWCNSIPCRLPKLSSAERLIWIDANGHGLTCGLDFRSAEQLNSYPVKVYRQIRTSERFYSETTQNQNA